MEMQPAAIEPSQAPAHGLANIGSGQGAATIAGIEPLLDAFAEADLVIVLLLYGPGLGVFLEPCLLFDAKLGELVLRQ